MPVRLALLPFLLPLAQPALAGGEPACRLCRPADVPEGRESRTEAEQPLRIEIESALDFSRLARTSQDGGSGDARIDPQSGVRSVSGGLLGLGGMSFRGVVRLSGTPGRAIRVDVPRRVALRSATGGTADVTDIVTDLSPAPVLGADGRLSFSFGGRLEVKGAVSGTLRGSIPITADYQ